MTDLIILIAGAALPSAALIVWFYRKDRARPEPLGMIWKSVALGFLGAGLAIPIELFVDIPAGFLPRPFSILWTAFLTAAFVEEGVKFFFLKRSIYRSGHFDEVMDGIVYAVCVSLGFAFAENLLYGAASRLALILRAFTAVPMHAAATGIMGYWLGLAKRETDARRAAALSARGFWAAVAVHGLYDFFLFAGDLASLFALAVLGVSLRRLSGYVREAAVIDEAAAGRSSP